MSSASRLLQRKPPGRRAGDGPCAPDRAPRRLGTSSRPVLAGLLAGLLLAGSASAETIAPRDEPVLLTGDRVIFDTRGDRVTAEGNVEISRGGRRLLADRVTYDQAQNRVRAEGNVVLLEPTGEAFFGDALKVTGDLREGLVERLRVLLANDARLAAARGSRQEGRVTELEDAVFSPCPVCAEDTRQPLWQIRADRVHHDQAERTVTYRNARFELFGVPVAYTPYLTHPDPSVKRKSGFLTPSFGSSSTLGLSVETPYYFDLAPNRDFTLAPIFTTDAGVVLAGEYRQLTEAGRTTLAGSVTHTEAYQSQPTDERDDRLRGHLEGEGRYRFGENDAGFDLAWASDNTYLRRYDFSNADVLRNRAYVERLMGHDYLAVQALAFQGLREDDDQGLIPIVLPLAQSRLRSSRFQDGSRVTLDSSLVALTRTEGLDTRRVSTEAGWEKPWIGGIGDEIRLRFSLRGDLYYYDGDPESFSSSGGEGSAGRLVPRATVDWRWPLIDETGPWQHVVEPVVSLNAAPYDLNDNGIPNEDSIVFEFDETNLFEADRFTGLDRVDEGVRVAYGLRFSSYGPAPLSVGGVVGQSWQPRRNRAFPSQSGVEKNFSDYVGRIDLRPSELVDLSYRFRLDRSDLVFRRNDINLAFGPPRLRFNIGYIELTDDPVDLAPREREEITAGVRVQMLDSLAVGAQFRRDLAEGRAVSNLFGLVYSHPCLVLVAGFEQRFTETGELEDETRFKVQVSLTGLGDGVSGLFGR